MSLAAIQADPRAPSVDELKRLRTSYEFFASRILKIRTKTGVLKPFLFNRAQKFLDAQINDQLARTGMVRKIVVKGRKMGSCYTPSTPVLMADYRWVRIGDVKPGDELIAVDEFGIGRAKNGKLEHRRMRTATVEAVARLRKPIVYLHMASGRVISVTKEHRHLCRKRGGDDAQWRTVEDTRVGDYIRAACNAPRAPDPDDQWAGGLLDGEGSFSATPTLRMTMAQTEGPVLDRYLAYLGRIGVNHYNATKARSADHHKPLHCARVDCFSDIVELITRTRPTRFTSRRLYEGKKLPFSTPRFESWDEVRAISYGGEEEVIDLQTSEKTFIANGLVSHNSTYVEGRFYWKNCKAIDPLRAFILAHEAPASDAIFEMTKTFYAEHPAELARPIEGASSAKELVFADNGCSYGVATAGTKATGRSQTIQLFHGSEVAYWPNDADHVSGAMNAVGLVPGTEIILESTGNGIGNLFSRMAQAAIRGQSEFEVVFMPWWLDEENERPCPDTFEPSKEWREYGLMHRLTWEQLFWAYMKNRDEATAISEPIDRPCWKFRQEYPATFEEAFQTSGNSFIPAASVYRARKVSPEILGSGPIILGIDPARTGDKVGIIDRCGRRAGQRIAKRIDPPGNTVTLASMIARIIDQILPDAVNIDMGSTGAALYDILLDLGYGYCLNAVNFGGNPIGTGPTGDDVYFNRRAEMYDLARQWFETEGGVMIPDDDGLQQDLCAPQLGPGATRWNTSNELIIEEKEAIKKRIGASPDLGDAFVLTFAVPFSRGAVAQNQPAPNRSRRSRSRAGYG